MNGYRDNIGAVVEFAELSAKSKSLSAYMKKKVPVELRKKWYKETVVRAIAEYNRLCEEWIKENVK